MTKFELSNSVALAFKFAHQLMAGALNVRRDLDSEQSALVEIHYEDAYFSTKIARRLQAVFSRHVLTRLEIEDSEEDPNSQWPLSERRRVNLFTRTHGISEQRSATFVVYRDYCDGDSAEGWTGWSVKDVEVFFGVNKVLELIRKITDHDDEPLWGVHPKP